MKRQPEHASQPPKSRIPEFASREEEAEFWDTHDLSDYWDELKPVEVRFAKTLSKGIVIPLDSETIGELRELARQQGTSDVALARAWVIEHLRKVRSGSA